MIGWGIALVILIAVGLIRLGVHFLYENGKIRLDILVCRFRICLIGEEKARKKNPKKTKSSKEKKNSDKPKQKKPKEKKNILENPWVKAVLEYWRDILALIGKVLRSPTLDVLKLEMYVGGNDIEKCALTYGRMCAIVGAVLPVVENTFGIRKRKINIWCCYDLDKTKVNAEASITVRIYEIFALVFAMLGLGIKILIYATKMKKAVQNS